MRFKLIEDIEKLNDDEIKFLVDNWLQHFGSTASETQRGVAWLYMSLRTAPGLLQRVLTIVPSEIKSMLIKQQGDATPVPATDMMIAQFALLHVANIK